MRSEQRISQQSIRFCVVASTAIRSVTSRDTPQDPALFTATVLVSQYREQIPLRVRVQVTLARTGHTASATQHDSTRRHGRPAQDISASRRTTHPPLLGWTRRGVGVAAPRRVRGKGARRDHAF